MKTESGSEKVSSVFYSPQASSGFFLLCVSRLQGEKWMIQWERLTVPLHYTGMLCRIQLCEYSAAFNSNYVFFFFSI